MNTQIVGLSNDTIYSYIAWFRTIYEKLVYKGLKNIKIGFPIISDIFKEAVLIVLSNRPESTSVNNHNRF